MRRFTAGAERLARFLYAVQQVTTQPVADALYWHLGQRWALPVSTLPLAAVLAVPWVFDVGLWWQPVNLVLSFLAVSILIGVLIHWARFRAVLKGLVNSPMEGFKGRPLWYGLDCKPCSVEEADRLLGHYLMRTVAKSEIDGWLISTMFMCLDQSLGRSPQPVLWETMVFNREGEPEGCRRYTSREDAVYGHAEVVGEVRNVFRQMHSLGREGIRERIEGKGNPDND